MSQPATRIAVAIVESDGHILVGSRSDGVPLAGHDEFPGGKFQSGETSRACVVRECSEETGLVVIPKSHLVTTTHKYDHGTVELHFWRCQLAPELPGKAAATAPFRWVPASELSTLNFPAGNAEALELLANETTASS